MTARDPRRGGYVAPPTTPPAPRPPLRSQAAWERDAQLARQRAQARRAHTQGRLTPRGRALGYTLGLIAVLLIVLYVAVALGIAVASNIH